MVDTAALSYDLGPNRPNKVSPELERAIQEAVTAVYGPGHSVKIRSGRGEYGSRRHRLDAGIAADVQIFAPNGQELRGDKLAPIAQHWLGTKQGSVGFPTVGATGAGNWLHLDFVGGNHPNGEPLGKGEGLLWRYGNGSIPSSVTAARDKGTLPNYAVDPMAVRSGAVQLAPVVPMPGSSRPNIFEQAANNARIAARPIPPPIQQDDAGAPLRHLAGTMNINDALPLLREARLSTHPLASYAPPLPSNTLNVNDLPVSRGPSRGVASRGPITAPLAPPPPVTPVPQVGSLVPSRGVASRGPVTAAMPPLKPPTQVATRSISDMVRGNPNSQQARGIIDSSMAALSPAPRPVTPMPVPPSVQQTRATNNNEPISTAIKAGVESLIRPPAKPAGVNVPLPAYKPSAPPTFAPPKPTVNVPLPPGAGYASLPTPSFGAKPAAPAPVMPMPPISRGPTPVMPMPTIARPGVVPMPASARPASSTAPMPLPASARPVAAPVLSGKAGLKPTVGGVMYGASNADKDKEKKDSGVGKGASGGAATPAAKAAPYGTKAIGADGKIKTKTVNSKGVAVWK